jgi:anti-sigma factor RsiW
MRHVTTQIDEYLRGELTPEQRTAVAAHLEACPECRAHAEWVEHLQGLVRDSRREPPPEVLAGLARRLLAVPREAAARPVGPARRFRLPPLPVWRTDPAPLLRAAALVVLGVVVGYGVWGRRPSVVSPQGLDRTLAARAPAAEATLTPAPGTAGGEAIEALEARVQALEKAIYASHFARVEASMLRFVDGAAEGELAASDPQNWQGLLMVTSNLKAERKSADDVPMVRLLGQIESVLMEMDRLSRERDLAGARRMAAVIQQQGLLPALQRLKVGIDE